MLDGWFVVRSFLTENPKFSAHIFALPLDVNVPHSVEQKARLSGGGVVFHSKVFTIARELVFRERLGKEVSRVELGADVANITEQHRTRQLRNRPAGQEHLALCHVHTTDAAHASIRAGNRVIRSAIRA